MPSTDDDNNDEDSAAAAEEATQARIKQKQETLLLELSATVNTLTSLGQVLDDIVALTDEPAAAAAAAATTTTQSSSRAGGTDKEDIAQNNSNNILHKQQLLLNELNEWKHAIGGMRRSQNHPRRPWHAGSSSTF